MISRCDGCGQPPRRDTENATIVPLLKCTRCRRSSYHDVICQRRHYPLHKTACRGRQCVGGSSESPLMFAVQPKTFHGTNEHCLVAIANVEPGFNLGTKTALGRCNFAPMVPPVLFHAQRSSHCAVCFASITKASATTTKTDPRRNHSSAPPPTTTMDPKMYDAPIEYSTDPRYPVVLCSPKCQSQAHPWLPQEVTMAASVLQTMPSEKPGAHIFPTALLIFRLLLRCCCSDGQKQQTGGKGTTTSATTIPPFLDWNELWSLKSHDERALSSSGDEDSAARIHQQAVTLLVMQMIVRTKGLVERLMVQVRDFELRGDDAGGIVALKRLTQRMLNRVKINAFTIATTDNGNGDSTALGMALYETPSYRINHSCDPNAIQSYRFATGSYPGLCITVCRSIRTDEEVCISYIDNLHAPRKERHTALEGYNFLCHCSKCQIEAQIESTEM